MALSAEAVLQSHWRCGYLPRQDPHPVQILALVFLRQLSSSLQGQWSAPALTMNATDFVVSLERHQGQSPVGCCSLSRGELQGLPGLAAPGFRRSER